MKINVEIHVIRLRHIKSRLVKYNKISKYIESQTFVRWAHYLNVDMSCYLINEAGNFVFLGPE